jgi:putative addiction module component (TIGR02574 family)
MTAWPKPDAVTPRLRLGCRLNIAGAGSLIRNVRSEVQAWLRRERCYVLGMKLVDFPEIRSLSAQQKLQLVDELWKDVAQDLEGMGIGQMEKELLDERWSAYLEDPASGLNLEEFKRSVRVLRG